jgi:ADP-ribose pyrophosphatase YjhB (NUDIX family)
VVGCIPELDGKILLCRRNIEPGKGRWTLPAGYLENGESVQGGAVRETREETRADVEIIEPYRLFNITFVDQIYMMFRARLLSGQFGPTRESMEVKLYNLQDIPWDRISFKVIHQTLEHYVKDRKENNSFTFGVFDIKQTACI